LVHLTFRFSFWTTYQSHITVTSIHQTFVLHISRGTDNVTSSFYNAIANETDKPCNIPHNSNYFLHEVLHEKGTN